MSSNPIQRHLFESRSVLIFGEVTMDMAQEVTAKLVAMAHADQEAPIKVIINSPGGHVEAGDTMHDMLQALPCPVYTIGTGWVASAGALIYLGVPKERRLTFKNTRFLLHQPSGGMAGTAQDIKIQAEEIIKMRERLNQIISGATGKSIENVRDHTDRDYWLSAEEAKDYGLVDRIITSFDQVHS